MSAVPDSGAGGATMPGSGGHGGTITFTFGTTSSGGGSGGWIVGGDGGYRATGGQGGGAGGATVVSPQDAGPPVKLDGNLVDYGVDVPWGGNGRDLGIDGVAAPLDASYDIGAPPIDGPLIRGFDAELAANMCPSAVACCRRLTSAVDGGIDGGSMAVCDDIARGDAWRCYEYLLTLQAQGRLCTDLPY